MMTERIVREFRKTYSGDPFLVRSPGRINLIGEHTDYNNGFVLPAAIDKEILLALRLNGLNRIRLLACDLGQVYETESKDILPSDLVWPNYLLGVVEQLYRRKISVPGFDCAFGGNIPIGAGLSSSAAIECGISYALNELLALKMDRNQLAWIALKAEHEFVGLQCGIMDQFANLFGKENHVIRLDCRSLEYEYYPLNLKNISIVLCDTRVKHSLASSEYNTRRRECEEGVAMLNRDNKGIKSLRDVSQDQIVNKKGEWDPKVYNRCLYVTGEIERVQAACEDLATGNIGSFGKKMFETHAGLSQLYEVSCKELDFLVESATSFDGVIGARMMGGGFGGCTINLVESDKTENFVLHTIRKYSEQFNKLPEIYHVAIKNGTSTIPL